MSILDLIRSFLRRPGTGGAKGQRESEPHPVGPGGLSNTVTSLLRWEPSKPVLVALGALIVFTIVGAWLYPQMIRTSASRPLPTPRAASFLLTPTASKPQPTATGGEAKPVSNQPGPAKSEAPAPAYPAPAKPVAATPTPAAGAKPAALPKAQVPVVPSPTRDPRQVIPAPVSTAGPSGSPAAKPVAGATPNAGAPTPTRTTLPTATAGPPTATPIPTPTNTPAPTPTPGPTTIAVGIPTLATGSGYFYVLDSHGGDLSVSWKTDGKPIIQVFVYAGAPFGGGSGIAGAPAGNHLAVSNAGSGSATITPIKVSPGTYTVYFYSGAMVQVATRSASITYVPSRPASSPSPTGTSVRTPTPAAPTPVGGMATPTRTSTPGAIATPTSTPTRTPTPVIPAYPPP